MPRRIPLCRSAVLPLALAFAVAGCGLGGPTEPPSAAIGAEVVVEHTDVGAAADTPTTTLAVTVLEVREGTHAELAEHFVIDPEDEGDIPWYVDVRFENRGSAAIDRRLRVSLEDGNGDLISATAIIDIGGTPFELCPRTEEGDLRPGDSVETCSFFVLDAGRRPARVSFLPYAPGTETDFMYWAIP